MNMKNKEYFFPVCVFGYKRATSLFECLTALSECSGAQHTDVFVFLDGPKSQIEMSKTNEVHEVAKLFVTAGFKSISIKTAKNNKGLANSIINGVTEVLKGHSALIVLEDDLKPKADFLRYMNASLLEYASNPEIGSISGFGYKLFLKGNFSNYFHGRPNTWGWGTWSDRWNAVTWELSKAQINGSNMKRDFNRYCGEDMYRMLNAYLDGKIDSWGVRWAYYHYTNNLKASNPVYSKIENFGYDEDGTNCSSVSLKPNSTYKFEREFSLREETKIDWIFKVQLYWQHSNFNKIVLHIIRFFGKFINANKNN